MKKDIKIATVKNDEGIVKFSWSSDSGTIEGRDRLVQKITKRILTLKGSNYFEEGFGENFFKLFGIIDRSRVDQIKEAFPVMVQSLEDSIKEEQVGDTSLEASEKLKELNLQDVEFDEKFSAWIIKIQVVTEDLVPVTITL